MKWSRIIVGIVVLLILIIPIPTGVYKDGGTKVYSALTYKIVKWKRLYDGGELYEKTRVYFVPKAYRSIDALWDEEEQYVIKDFVGQIETINLKNGNVMVLPLQGVKEANYYERITFQLDESILKEFNEGDFVSIKYQGAIMESDPAQIHAIGMEPATDLRPYTYEGEWLSDTAEEVVGMKESDLVISKIYEDCFFASPVLPSPIVYKLNGKLDEKWCVGDKVYVRYSHAKYDDSLHRFEADFHEVTESTFEPEPGMSYKPVIYLYPETEMKVSVRLTLNGKLTCTYPSYGTGWNVTASPDGTLTDGEGMTYNYLYWEGETYANYDFSKGFCVKGEETAAFLEEALEKLGLNRKEANEFIVYWLPLMQENPYNIISFQTDAYTQAAKLSIHPSPDTLIRVFMVWKPSEKFVNIEEQKLTAPQRTGFTVVEWGGTEK